jgi:hypothetical protein
MATQGLCLRRCWSWTIQAASLPHNIFHSATTSCARRTPSSRAYASRFR